MGSTLFPPARPPLAVSLFCHLHNSCAHTCLLYMRMCVSVYVSMPVPVSVYVDVYLHMCFCVCVFVCVKVHVCAFMSVSFRVVFELLCQSETRCVKRRRAKVCVACRHLLTRTTGSTFPCFFSLLLPECEAFLYLCVSMHVGSSPKHSRVLAWAPALVNQLKCVQSRKVA